MIRAITRNRQFVLTPKQVIVGAFFFFVLNVILRSLHLGHNPLSGDEPFTLYHAQMSPSVIISELLKGNNPPLFELLLHYWIQLGDISVQWIRILPLIFSALTAFFLFILANKLKQGVFPFIVSLIYTFSVYHLQYAHEIRVYSLFGLLSVISMLLYWKVWQEFAPFKTWVLLVLVNSLLIYSHYFGFFLLLIQTLAWFWDKDTRRHNVRNYLLYILAMIVLYIPLIPIVLQHFILSDNTGKTWLAPASSFEDLYNMLWKFSNKPVVTVIGIVIIVSAVVKYILDKNKSLTTATKLLITWFAISFFGMFLISFKVPMYLDRYLIYGSFAYILILVYALDYLFVNKKIYELSSLLVIVLFGATFSLSQPTKRNAPHIADTVRQAIAQKYAVVICPREFTPAFLYYYDQKLFQKWTVNPLYGNVIEELKAKNIFSVWNVDDIKQTNDKWLFIDVAAALTVPQNGILNQFDTKFTRTNEIQLDEITKGYYFRVKSTE